jgi:hypothetical protein
MGVPAGIGENGSTWWLGSMAVIAAASFLPEVERLDLQPEWSW